jgi:hypothetical protein
MRPALIKNHPAKPELWEDLALGYELKTLIESELSEVSRKFFGYH